MESLVCDIAKNRIKRAFDDAFREYGLFVTKLQFDESDGLSVIVEFSADENVIIFDAS